MRRCPLLLGAALLFWGWQTDFFLVGLLMAVIVEGAHVIRIRWAFSDDDFSRIWTVCTLLFLGAAIYAFTDNGGPSQFSGFMQHTGPAGQNSASVVTSRTASAVLRWMPMSLFLFVAAQAYSSRQEIPLATISLFHKRRHRRAEKLRRGTAPMPTINIFYPYFTVCMLAAGIHPAEDKSYFWGLCLLLTWVLWLNRTRRFGVVLWSSALALVFVAGYFGQEGIGRLQGYIQNLQNLDGGWIARFGRQTRADDPRQSLTSIGRVGRVKNTGEIVVRLEPKEGVMPDYLREASYRFYKHDQGRARTARWEAGVWGETLFEPVSDRPLHSQIYPLVTGKTNLNRVGISCYLDAESPETGYRMGLLPLPSGCSRLENLPVFGLRKNALGAVVAEGPGMVMFDAAYGPGSTLDMPFDPAEVTTNYNVNPDLAVPWREAPALDAILSELKLNDRNLEQRLHELKRFFATHFRYSLWQDPTNARSNEEALTRFLLKTRSGHCEYFASATVLILRRMGIPARYAIGYAVHEKSGDNYVVRQRDAHAWCLVWNGTTWQDYDTTPPDWAKEEASDASIFERISDIGSWLRFQFWRFRIGQSNLRPYLLLALVPALGLSLYQILFRKGRIRSRTHQKPQRIDWPGLDSEFYLVEKRLARDGILRPLNEPLSNWLCRIASEPRLAPAAGVLRDLVRLHYRYRFDPQALTSGERQELRIKAQSVLAELSARKR